MKSTLSAAELAAHFTARDCYLAYVTFIHRIHEHGEADLRIFCSGPAGLHDFPEQYTGKYDQEPKGDSFYCGIH